MKRPRVVVLCWSLTASVLILAGAGCDEFADPYRTIVPSGRIQGRVSTGGQPVEAFVFLDRIDDHDENLSIRMEVAADGSFGMEVPAADYAVSLQLDELHHRYRYATPLAFYGSGTPDTVRVDEAHSPVTTDFDLGGLAFSMAVSSQLDGVPAAVVVHRRDDAGDPSLQSAFDDVEAEIVAGRLEARFTGLLPGAYRIEVVLGGSYDWSSSYRHEHFWLPGTRNPAASPWYEVSADTVVTVNAAFTALPARLEGRISGAWLDLTPDSRPRLSFVTPDSTELIGDLEVDRDGGFAVDFLLPDPVKIFVAQEMIGQWIGGTGFADAEVFNPSPGQAITGIDLVQCGLLLRFVLHDPHPSVLQFRLFDPVDLTLLSVVDLYGSSRYDFGIPNLRPGAYLAHIGPEHAGSTSWRAQWYDRAPTAEQALPVLLMEPGEIVELALTLERGGELGGLLVLPAGSESDYVVVATPAQECVEWGHRLVFPVEPGFSLLGLPDGAYKVGAVLSADYYGAPDFPPAGFVWYPGTTDWNAAGIIEIIDAATVSGVDIVIPGA